MTKKDVITFSFTFTTQPFRVTSFLVNTDLRSVVLHRLQAFFGVPTSLKKDVQRKVHLKKSDKDSAQNQNTASCILRSDLVFAHCFVSSLMYFHILGGKKVF